MGYAADVVRKVAAMVDRNEYKRAQAAPKAANLPGGIADWCRQIEAEKKGKYPIDQADGGCDDLPPCDVKTPMDLHQTPALEIRNEDALSDSGVEVWNVLEQRRISNVMLLGVHTNMCVLGRPFGLRNMARFGKNVVLVRDLTDTMYNPRAWPRVSHFRGTELIVEHIEKYVCPTITSDQLLGGKPFRFSTDRRKHVAVVMSEDEYKTAQTLTLFARAYLQRDFRLSLFYADARDMQSLPGIEQLAEADVAMISVRRRALLVNARESVTGQDCGTSGRRGPPDAADHTRRSPDQVAGHPAPASRVPRRTAIRR